MKKLDLSGIWKLWMDENDLGQKPEGDGMTMPLPGTTSFFGMGRPNQEEASGYLTDSFRFEGSAWFERNFIVPENEAERSAWLYLERTRRTRVFLDGNPMGSEESLCTPHIYPLGKLSVGQHRLLVCVQNTDYPTRGGHMTSPDTQSNWNGIVGEISLLFCDAYFAKVQLFPQPEKSSLLVKAEIAGECLSEVSLSIDGEMRCTAFAENGQLEAAVPMNGFEPWDEFHPRLYTLRISIGEEYIEKTFGMRRFATEGRSLLLNGNRLFLRGKHDGLIHPLTGYAPMDKESWRKVLGIAKQYGINHYRFHTCCPPEAAFAAADELGIYMSPELPFWGTILEEGEEGYNDRERKYLIREGFRILETFGHHPSFMMLSLGNELWGSENALNEMLKNYRAFDPDKLYVSGSNNFQFVPRVLEQEDVFVGVRFGQQRLIRGSYAMCDAPRGIVQVTEPESQRDFDAMIVPETLAETETQGGKRLIQYQTGVKEVESGETAQLIPQVPVISHEVGQYCFYPDFDETPRYTGPLKARNFEIFRKRLEEKQIFSNWKKYFRSAGLLAVDCYRREIETALRSEELSGFQLLDLQDFSGQGTALVGVLNAFMESKGLIDPAQWRRFCAPVNVLAKFDRFVVSPGEEIRFGVVISETRPGMKHEKVRCSLWQDGREICNRELTARSTGGRLWDCGVCAFDPLGVSCAGKVEVRLETEYECENRYTLWCIPAPEVSISREGIRLPEGDVKFVRTVEEARSCTNPAIVVPSGDGKLPAEYCSDFWCYPMFRSISESMNKPVPVGTLGLYIQKEAEELEFFPTESYTTPQWYRILKTAHLEELSPEDEPVVEMIDNVERCKRFGILYRKNGVLHLTAKLWHSGEDAEVKAFAASVAASLLK